MDTEATRTLHTIKKFIAVNLKSNEGSGNEIGSHWVSVPCAMSDICTTCDKSREVQR